MVFEKRLRGVPRDFLRFPQALSKTTVFEKGKSMGERTRRLHILDEAEVAALFNLPSFDDEQRAGYFSLTA